MCPYCTHNGAFVMVESAKLEAARDAVQWVFGHADYERTLSACHEALELLNGLTGD